MGIAVHFPELFRDKGTDFPFTLDHQLHGHRLDAAGGQPPGNLFPQQGRDHEPHHPVQETAGLLGFHPAQVQLAGLFKGSLNGLLGNFIEHHPVEPGVFATDHFPQVPGNGLPFAVQVSGEVDAISLGGQPLEFVDDLFLARQDLIVRVPAVFRVHPHTVDQLGLGLLLFIGFALFLGQRAGVGCFLGPFLRGALFGAATDRQVPHMADTGLHNEVVSQVAV